MISRFTARLIFAPFAKIHLLHPQRSSQSGAFILAANHISHFDPPLVSIAARRKLDWMAMAELFENRIFAAWARAIDIFPTDRFKVDRASVKTALTRLNLNHSVAIFPEGGIRDGARSVLQGAPMLSGIAAIAHLANAPIIPCVILGSDRLYNLKALSPFRRVKIHIGFAAPLQLDPSLEKSAARKKLEADLGDSLRALLKEMYTHFNLMEEDLPQSPGRRKGREQPDHPHKTPIAP